MAAETRMYHDAATVSFVSFVRLRMVPGELEAISKAVLFLLASNLPAFLKFRNSSILMVGVMLLSGESIYERLCKELGIFLKLGGTVWCGREARTTFFFPETMGQILGVVNIHSRYFSNNYSWFKTLIILKPFTHVLIRVEIFLHKIPMHTNMNRSCVQEKDWRYKSFRKKWREGVQASSVTVRRDAEVKESTSVSRGRGERVSIIALLNLNYK